MNVGKVKFSGMVSLYNSPDAEWLAIIRKLLSYGKTSTGSKSGDKDLLHSIELEKAKLENNISSKFLTVTKNEQEKIQSKKKEKRIENNPELYPNSQQGAKVLGEQLYLSIQMKKKKF